MSERRGDRSSLIKKMIAGAGIVAGAGYIGDAYLREKPEVPPVIKHELDTDVIPDLPEYETAQKAQQPYKKHDGTGSKESGLVLSEQEIEAVSKEFSPEAAAYAKQIIHNGQCIVNSPHKREALRGIITELQNKYSSRIKIPKFFGYIDDAREFRQVAAVSHYCADVGRRAKKRGVDLPVSFVVAAMGNEGRLLDIYGQSDIWHAEISGFHSLGLDRFAEDFDDIRDRGLLPKDFDKEFTASTAVNEKGKQVKSAHFRSKGSAIRAMISELAVRQLDVFRHLKQKNISLDELSPEQKKDVSLFLTYIYYNAGQGIGKSIVDSFASSQDALAYFERAKHNPSAINLTSAPANAYVVLAGAEWLERTGATDGKPAEKKYWWLTEDHHVAASKNK